MSQETGNGETLARILEAVQIDRHTRWVEAACAVLLSLATLVSGWCVYQASQWAGEQFFRIEDFNGADRKRLQAEMKGTQQLSIDGLVLIQYVQASVAGNKAFADILRERFPPHLKTAVEAWLNTDPFNNSSAPRTPFVMKDYVIPETAEIEQHTAESERFRSAANQADNNSDMYLLLSLLMSTVLFFSGLAGVIRSYRLQTYVLGLAAAVFLIAIILLLRLPVIV